MTRIVLHLCFLLTTGWLLVGCSPGVEVILQGNAVGDYTLVRVGGSPVPASVNHDGVKLEVRSGTFTIRPDGTCGTRTVFVPPSGQAVTREASASYRQEGSKLTMQWNGAGTTVGAVKGDTFTMNNEGLVFEYQK